MNTFELGIADGMEKIAYGLYELPDHMRENLKIKHKRKVFIEMKDSQIHGLRKGGFTVPKRAPSRTEKDHWKARAAHA